MRTNIVIDDSLMADALTMTGAKSKREVVEIGLETQIQLKSQEKLQPAKASCGGAVIWMP